MTPSPQTSVLSEPAVIPSNGERMVYLVRSDSSPDRRYRCDLLGCGGAGQCACTDWATRRCPALAQGSPKGTRATLCKHLILARRFFLQQLLDEMARSEQTPPSATRE